MEEKKNSSLGGFEPPTFRLTAERASRLRHRDAIHVHANKHSSWSFISLFELKKNENKNINFLEESKTSDIESLWRNRLARSAVNRKVGGSNPPRDEFFLFLFLFFFSCEINSNLQEIRVDYFIFQTSSLSVIL